MADRMTDDPTIVANPLDRNSVAATDQEKVRLARRARRVSNLSDDGGPAREQERGERASEAGAPSLAVLGQDLAPERPSRDPGEDRAARKARRVARRAGRMTRGVTVESGVNAEPVQVPERNRAVPDAGETVPLQPSDVSFRGQPAAARPRGGIWKLLAGLVVVGIPTVCTGLYLALWSTPQYVSEIRFAVRGPEAIAAASAASGSSGGLLGPTAANPLSLISDSYIVVDYLLGREIIEKLEKNIQLTERYTRHDADYFARLEKDLSIEQLVNFWQRKVKASFDHLTGIVTVEIRAFSSKDAHDIAIAVLQEMGELVNNLSQRAREDAVRSAREDLRRSEKRIQDIRAQIRQFRDRAQIADPVASATEKHRMLAQLEAQLTQINAAMGQRRGFLGESSPTMTNLRARAEAIEQEIARAKAELGSEDTSAAASMAGTLASYEELEVQRLFAEKAFLTALSALETARSDAERLRRYLAVYVEPKMAEYPTYPKALEDTLLTFLALSVAFGLLVLFLQGLRERAG
jgi:capsular polysaccharide transport system permease protein